LILPRFDKEKKKWDEERIGYLNQISVLQGEKGVRTKSI
jgi:hypothetical protein